MFVKKIILAGSLVAAGIANMALASPLIDKLYVFNNTDKPSSVMVTSNPIKKNFCAPKSTAPHAVSDTDALMVRVLCSSNPCHAELYTSNNCTDEHIADIVINTSTLMTTVEKLYYPEKYDVVPTGRTVNINQIK